MKHFFKKYSSYLIIFFFFLIIFSFMPLCGDDWHNYNVGSLNLTAILGQTIGMYFDWEGRIISRLLINLLTYHKVIFNILEALLITISIYLMNNLIKPQNNKLFFLLTCWLFLFLENTVFTQTILWVAGSITYLFPTLMIFGYLYFFYKYLLKKNKYSKIFFIIFPALSFLLTLFVENITLAFIAMNIILIVIYYYRKKEINKLLIINTISSCLGAFILLISPGSYKRLLYEDIAFSQLPFYIKIYKNYHHFIYYTISHNTYLIILMTIVGCILTHKYIKNIIVKIFTIASISIYPFLNIIFNLATKNSNIYTNLYWSIYLIYILTISYIYLKRKKENYFYPFIIPALIANLTMLLTPAISSRTSLFTIIFLSFYFIYILDNLLSNKTTTIIYKIAIIPTYLIGAIYLIAYFNLYQFNLFQKQELLTKKEKVVIYEAPSYLAWGLTPHGDYHSKTFKEYYKLDANVTFEYRKSTWDYFIFFNQEKTKSISSN